MSEIISNRSLKARLGVALIVGGVGCLPVHHAMAQFGPLLQTMGDFASLGETARRRDEANANAAAAAAAQRRAAALREHNTKLQTLNTEIGTLSGFATRVNANLDLVNGVIAIQDKIVDAAAAEISSRERANAEVERLADSQRKTEKDLEGLAKALNAMTSLESAAAGAKTNAAPAVDQQATAFQTARQILRTADLDNESGGTYLNKAVKELKTERLQAIVTSTSESRISLKGLKASLDVDQKTYAEQIAGKQKALDALKASPS